MLLLIMNNKRCSWNFQFHCAKQAIYENDSLHTLFLIILFSCSEDLPEDINPNIDNIVKNDIVLDPNNNLVITGPNAGGKSTFIKSIAINIILSQTLCIAFCDKIELTPFYY